MGLYKNWKPVSEKEGFTLTEIILAVGIVGVIAALVLPAVITHYSSSMFDAQLNRQRNAIMAAVNSLVINENKTNFGETMMYAASTPESYEDTAGKFMKKYLRVSKYYGDYETNKNAVLTEGFAKEYYSYTPGKTKDVYDLKSQLKGACATLKSGAAICLQPQIVGAAPKFWIDLNGQNGPNIEGRDLRVGIALDRTLFNSRGNVTAGGVSDLATGPIVTDEGNPCPANSASPDCCEYKVTKGGGLTGTDDPCCRVPGYEDEPACAQEILLELDVYPTSDCFPGKSPYCNDNRFYASPGRTKATQDGKEIKTFKKDPPPIYIYCGAEYAGTIDSSGVRQMFEKEQKYYFTVTSTTANRYKSCVYKVGYGIKPTGSSFVFAASAGGDRSKIQHNGITWRLSFR